MSDIKIIESDMSNTRLLAADLSDSQLMMTNFADANFTGVNLSNANLQNALGLTQTQLDKAWSWADALPINLPGDLKIGKVCNPENRKKYITNQRFGIPKSC